MAKKNNVVAQAADTSASAEKTMKRGTVIQAVKAIAVLVIICLICGILLALCNDLFYVSEDVKFDRAMSKIAPGFQKDKSFAETPVAEFASNNLYGEVQKIYKSSDANNPSYVMLVKGAGVGYQNGNVTIYVAVSGDKANPVILGWSIVENEGQTFIGKITNAHIKKWFIGHSVSEMIPTNPVGVGKGLGSGATMTENSIISAINMACYYSMNALGLGENPEKNAKEAILELLGEDFADATLTALSTNYFKQLSTDTEQLEYVFSIQNGSQNYYGLCYAMGEDKAYIVTMATALDTDRATVIAKSDNVSEELASKITSYYFTDLAYITNLQDVDGNKVYTVVGNKPSGYMPNSYTLTVTVDTDGKVVTCQITKDGQLPFELSNKTDDMATAVVGKTLSDLNDTFFNPSSNKGQFTGATQSANIIFNAVKLCLTHFEANK